MTGSPKTEVRGFSSFFRLPAFNIIIMTDLFKGYGIVSSEILNVSPGEAFKLCGKGAVIVDWSPDGLALKTNIEERLTGSCICQLKPREGRRKGEGEKRREI